MTLQHLAAVAKRRPDLDAYPPPDGGGLSEDELIAAWRDSYVDQLHGRLLRRADDVLVVGRPTLVVRVEVRKPRLMPRRLHRWLMRSIVVVDGPLHIGGSDPVKAR
jgi:hypothetical protein